MRALWSRRSLLCCSAEGLEVCQLSKTSALKTNEQFVDLSVIETKLKARNDPTVGSRLGSSQPWRSPGPNKDSISALRTLQVTQRFYLNAHITPHSFVATTTYICPFSPTAIHQDLHSFATNRVITFHTQWFSPLQQCHLFQWEQSLQLTVLKFRAAEGYCSTGWRMHQSTAEQHCCLHDPALQDTAPTLWWQPGVAWHPRTSAQHQAHTAIKQQCSVLSTGTWLLHGQTLFGRGDFIY